MSFNQTSYQFKVLDSLSSISSNDWNALNEKQNPFLSYDFLYSLEKFDCLKNQHWQSNHFVLYDNDTLIAAVPGYYKTDSYGEFVFDWAWADAYQRAGKSYYPKFVSAIPFTPVLGNRLLVKEKAANKDSICNTFIKNIIHEINQNDLSSAHFLFSQQALNNFADDEQLLTRLTWQYHWKNRGYESFNDFLNSLNSKRRKQIRKERRAIDNFGLEFEVLEGNAIREHHWNIFYDFYCSTFERKWGEPRFTLPFFQNLSETMPENIILILAKDQSGYIAGAFAMRSKDTLYGRHWGCNKFVQNLHFECCYYQTIDYCIRNQLSKLDAGIQGEHKIFRGFEPVVCKSYHYITEPTFRNGIADFLVHETKHINEQIDLLNQHLPYTLKV